MALHAKLNRPCLEHDDSPWHKAEWTIMPAKLLMSGDRRMEAENYLAGGYNIRLAIQSRQAGWHPLERLANVWQPSRLKGIQVSQEYGTPFLAATQVFDLRPVPRKFLSLDRTFNAVDRLVKPGSILVTCSGNVRRATLAYKPHEDVLISHDLLRVDSRHTKMWGWLYAYLRASKTRSIMQAAHYGHVIKHLEVSHLNALPVPVPCDDVLIDYQTRAEDILCKRNKAYALLTHAEHLFSEAIGPIESTPETDAGFVVRADSLFDRRRRLEAAYYGPTITTILKCFSTAGLMVEPLFKLTKRVWLMNRFKRIFGDEGIPYMSADELFACNTPITKYVLLDSKADSADFFVKAGWIVMARSGQVYGLNGSVAFMTKRHEDAFISDDFIRIIPDQAKIRAGYLFMALGHPDLGRPLVIRNSYGTSIPHLDPSDVSCIPIVRLASKKEEAIADYMEEAVNLRAEADAAEDALAGEADALIAAFIAGDTKAFVSA